MSSSRQCGTMRHSRLWRPAIWLHYSAVSMLHPMEAAPEGPRKMQMHFEKNSRGCSFTPAGDPCDCILPTHGSRRGLESVAPPGLAATAAARAAFALVLACGSILTTACGAPPIAQPIPFNHGIHTANSLTCDVCHEFVFERANAGIPRVEVCAACHAADITQNPAARPYIERIRANAQQGTEIPWVRLYRLKPNVYFSHRRHTKIAGLDCSVCHGNIGDSHTPVSRPVARTLDMDGCMDCHEKRGVDINCSWCHR